ncbi:MAG: MATE family efflux transporter [Lachnospiraceae bacterium]|nr:MATE family efflux transporter [Lachnospiraceae bacterium]
MKDFTKGPIAPALIEFTIPLVLGNIFQLLYNAVDSLIVGRFVGKEALAAVGTSNPLMTLAILFFNGITLGAGILIGNHYGSGDHDKMRRQISTTMLAGIGFSLVVSLLTILLAKPLLMLLQVETEVLQISADYLRIIFIGLVFTFMYNALAGSLRALGDSMGPLIFLVISSVINVIGDLILVVGFRMGVHGAALSTVLSEALSVLFCAVYIRRKVPVLHLGKEWLIFDHTILKQTLAYGTTSALQQATVQLGKIGVQAIVNTMGVSAMAAFTIVNRVDDFVYTPQQNIGHAMTSFMAINKGAGEQKRMRSGFKDGMIIEIAYGGILFLVCFFLARPIVTLFTTDEEVILHGTTYLKYIAGMYFLPALTNGIQGYFRGIGDLKITLISSMTNMGVRLIFALIFVFGFGKEIEAMPLSYMIGWIAMLIVEMPLLFRSLRNMRAESVSDS